MHCEVFGNDIAPFRLPETPPVLSVGKRCMEEQYDFHWIRGQKPYLVTPDYKVVELEIHRNIPMLMVGDPDVVAKDARGFCTVPVAPVMVEEREDIFGDAVLDEHVVPEGEAHEPPDEGNVAPLPAPEPPVPPPEGERIRLKREAESREHKLTHIPKNHFCNACLRGKMKEKYSRRGAFRSGET